jgi:Uma2 family endonuclease
MAVTPRDAEAGVVGQRMTLDEFLALPETKPALEYIDGIVTQKPYRQGQRAILLTHLAMEIDAFAKPSKLALALPGLRTTYAGQSRAPDVAVYARHRIPVLPNGRIANLIPGPPDIIGEILSPDQSATELIITCIWCVKNGVRIALLVDPHRDTVLRFLPDALPDVLRGDDRIDLDEVLPGFELTVQQLFDTLLQG